MGAAGPIIQEMSAHAPLPPPSHPLSATDHRAHGAGRLVRMIEALSVTAAARVAEGLFVRTVRPPARPDEVEWLGNSARSSLTVLGRRIATYAWGPPTAPSVLLTHGWWSHAGRFVAIGTDLLERGFRVVAFDAPGHGRSSGWRASMPEFARTMRAVVERAGPMHAAIGHSLGGAATVFAASRGLPVQRIALIAAPADVGIWADRYRDALALSPAVDATMRSLLSRHLGVEWHELDLPAVVRSFPQPGLIVHDRDDGDVSVDSARAYARAWPGAHLHETSGLGHRKILRDPDVVRRVGEFVEAGKIERWKD
jgi:pimeloyl-ACP methyl ester carboxylesterase